SSRRRHTRFSRDWSSDVCSSDLGSLPPGVPADFYTELARLARQDGMRLVLDTSGEALRQAQGAYLLKPNRNELAQLAGRPLSGRSEERRVGKEWRSREWADDEDG